MDGERNKCWEPGREGIKQEIEDAGSCSAVCLPFCSRILCFALEQHLLAIIASKTAALVGTERWP
uniref:Uncharacterized protein n=1 Tax=Arundo donax TaxID=35708 RepID=A0A0A9FPK5_ARUDO